MLGKKSNSVIALIAIVILTVWMVMTYNSLVKKDEHVSFQWNEVQNNYQRRLDLIPQVVNTVKGGAEFEKGVLEQVTQARAKAMQVQASQVSAAALEAQSQIQDELALTFNRLLINVERYPEIKGTRAFKDLQVQLEGTERRIKVARKDFNGAVQDYNSAVRSFPTKIISGILGFPERKGFTADLGTDKSIEIKF
ncbi:MAG: LemA family protein [Ferruginibacter sp.]|nr:LemA family protein [Ferruginibacter sp.]